MSRQPGDHLASAANSQPHPCNPGRPGVARTLISCASMRDVYHRICDHPDATSIRSALEQTLAKIAGPLEHIPAHAKSVRRLLKVRPEHYGLTHRKLRADKKLIGAALRHCGLELMPSRFEVELLPEWQQLLAAVPYHPFFVELVRFARCCSMWQVKPDDVRPHHFLKYDDALRETTRGDLVRRKALLRVCGTWDKAAELYPQLWPAIRSQRTLLYRWYTRPMETYPEPLRTEIDALFADRRAPGLTSRWRAPIKQEAEATQRHHLRRFLHALCEIGVDAASMVSLARVLDPRTARAALEWMILRHGNRPTADLYNVAVLIRSIARNWLHLDGDELAAFDAIVSDIWYGLYADGRPTISPKTRELFLRLRDPALRAKIYGIGQRVQEKYAGASHLSRSAVRHVQSALAISLALVVCIRPTQLASLRIDRDIIVAEGTPVLRLTTREGALEIALPPPIGGLLALYRDTPRLRLRPHEGPWLFPGAGSKSMHPQVLNRHMAALLQAECNLRITAGQLRFVVGFLWLRAGHDRERVKELLGYRHVTEVDRVFGDLSSEASFDALDEHLATTCTDLDRSAGP